MKLNPAIKNIHDFKYEDFELVGYRSASADQGANCGVVRFRNCSPQLGRPNSPGGGKM
jgi:hypothetical protein